MGIMDALGIEKASFVGNSFGGALSIGLALFAPERVDKLVLLGTRRVNLSRPPVCALPGNTSRPWKTWNAPCVCFLTIKALLRPR